MGNCSTVKGFSGEFFVVICFLARNYSAQDTAQRGDALQGTDFLVRCCRMTFSIQKFRD
jgi:hypothetical protein